MIETFKRKVFRATVESLDERRAPVGGLDLKEFGSSISTRKWFDDAPSPYETVAGITAGEGHFVPQRRVASCQSQRNRVDRPVTELFEGGSHDEYRR